LDVVYEDECLLAVHKPAGVASQPRHRFESASMVNRAVAHLGRHPYPLHLLDGPTSGLLLFGKTLAAARAIERQFVERSAEKVYLAVLLGAPETDAFECALPIARRADALSTVSGGAALGGPARAALTSFAVVSRGAGAVACVVRPASGRLHQIRVHAAALGHPVAGDAQYGAAAQPGRLLLHALSLTVAHPARGGRVRFTALPPQDFLRGTAALGVDAAWDLP
ncbi:pseudouridine synthase, partial [Pelagophyceae sp. CCMP2097]